MSQTYTINQIKQANREAGYRWFDPDQMRFFGTQVLPRVYQGPGGVYFITLDKDYSGKKLNSLRRFDPETGSVNTVGDAASMSLAEAEAMAYEFAKGVIPDKPKDKAKRRRGRPRKEANPVTVVYEKYKPITTLEQFVADLDEHVVDKSLVNQRDAALLMTKAGNHQRLMERMCSDPTFQTNDEGDNQQVIDCRHQIVQLVTRLGVKNVVFSQDPRGATVKLIFEDGHTNDWGKEGYCVPLKEDDE